MYQGILYMNVWITRLIDVYQEYFSCAKYELYKIIEIANKTDSRITERDSYIWFGS